MKITKKFLKSLNPCQDGFKYWCEVKKPNLADFMLQAHSDNHTDWAYWLFVRAVSYDMMMKATIFAAAQVLEIFELKHPYNNAPRLAIEAAEKCRLNPNLENKHLAVEAAYSAYNNSVTYYAALAAAYTSSAFAGNSYYAVIAVADSQGTRKEINTKIINQCIQLLQSERKTK